jgi:hypothetical protein
MGSDYFSPADYTDYADAFPNIGIYFFPVLNGIEYNIFKRNGL